MNNILYKPNYLAVGTRTHHMQAEGNAALIISLGIVAMFVMIGMAYLKHKGGQR